VGALLRPLLPSEGVRVSTGVWAGVSNTWLAASCAPSSVELFTASWPASLASCNLLGCAVVVRTGYRDGKRKGKGEHHRCCGSDQSVSHDLVPSVEVLRTTSIGPPVIECLTGLCRLSNWQKKICKRHRTKDAGSGQQSAAALLSVRVI
jgi:hypothetical protein